MTPGTKLTMLDHGIEGTYLGVIDDGGMRWDVALVDRVHTSGELYVRRATTGYGGWRWEASRAHVATYPTVYPAWAALLKVIEK